MEIQDSSLLSLNEFATASQVAGGEYFMKWAGSDEDPKKITFTDLLASIQMYFSAGFNQHLEISWFSEDGSYPAGATPSVNSLLLNTTTGKVLKYTAGNWVVNANFDTQTVYICDKSKVKGSSDLNAYSLAMLSAGTYFYISKVSKTLRMTQESVLGKGEAVTTIAAKTNTSYDITGTVNELNVQSFENSFETETLISWNAGASPSLTMAAGMIMVSNIILQPNKRTVMVISRNTYALGQG